MPYDVTGYDSAGVLHASVMADDGSVSGDDDLLTGFLADNPLPSIEGDSPTDAELEAIRQQVSKLLTGVQVSKQPEPPEDPEPVPDPDPAPLAPPPVGA